MALVSLEQRRPRERADEQANKIRQELAEYDLAHSRDPIVRRRAEKQAERKALDSREAEQSQQTTNWMRWLDQRIEQHLRRYFGSGDEKHPGACFAGCPGLGGPYVTPPQLARVLIKA